MITLGVPTIGQSQLVNQMLHSATLTVGDPSNLEIVIIDNASDPAYLPSHPQTPFSCRTIRFSENTGYYRPLIELYNRFPDSEFVGLAHNDIIFYERGWDQAIHRAFQNDPLLGLIGLVGSNEADAMGGRGDGTMMNFRGELGQTQCAKRIHDLRPAMLLDSLFMVFRRSVIPFLAIDDNILLCHFYDKIWSLRTIESGFRVAVLGTEIDHIGGMTSCGAEYQLRSAKKWCERQNIAISTSADMAMYLEGEKRLLTEFRDNKGMIPGFVDESYAFHPGG